MADLSGVSNEELMAAYQQRRGGAPQQTQVAPKGNDLEGVLKTLGASGLIRKQNTNPLAVLGNALGAYGGHKAIEPKGEYGDLGTDIAKIAAGEAIKNQFEDPSVRQSREADIRLKTAEADSIGQPPPTGFVRVGRQLHPDPNYVKPMDQAKLDEEAAARGNAAEGIRASAEENLGAIKEAKEGSRFFGPFGNMPTILDPQSLGGLNAGHYSDRKVWENNINQLLKKKVVDLMTQMKQASKTGATGFGNLSDAEGQLLAQASTALSRDLPEEQALHYLNEMEKINQKILSGGTPRVGGSGGFDQEKEARYQAWKASQNVGA